MVKKTVKKVVLLGESAVGKTSLIKRFVHDEFADDYISTIGTKVSKKVINLNVEGQETQVNLMIWDMLGREGYMSTQARQIVGAQGVIIVGDITRPETMARPKPAAASPSDTSPLMMALMPASMMAVTPVIQVIRI